MPKLLVRLVLAALLLAACGGGQRLTSSPEPPPIAAVTATTAPPARATATSPPTPSSTPPPTPTPTPTSSSEPVPFTTEDGVEIAATPRAASRSDTPTPPPAPGAGTGGDDAFPALGDTQVRPADDMVMVYVPGGTFPMGSAEDDPESVPDELPQHLVTLDGFWIDQTEVANAQFVGFLNEHGNRDEQGVKMIVLDEGYAQISQEDDQFVTSEAALDRPVVMVTWHGAVAYCEWAGGRLPTEAEWEYAARGPEGNLYPWGNSPPTCDLANYGTCIGVPVQVGSRPAGASWCGALEMAGNVWEWVTDWFEPYSDLAQENPTGPASGDVPVLRGGGWHAPRWEIRAAYRQHETRTIGFNG
jgi:formylglycine-generating enzyme required for sulfatase activity